VVLQFRANVWVLPSLLSLRVIFLLRVLDYDVIFPSSPSLIFPLASLNSAFPMPGGHFADLFS
jgi:hypothetical protein